MKSESVLMEMPNSVPPNFIIETVLESISESFDATEMAIEVKLFEEKEDCNVFEITSQYGPKAFVYAGIAFGTALGIISMFENATHHEAPATDANG